MRREDEQFSLEASSWMTPRISQWRSIPREQSELVKSVPMATKSANLLKIHQVVMPQAYQERVGGTTGSCWQSRRDKCTQVPYSD